MGIFHDTVPGKPLIGCSVTGRLLPRILRRQGLAAWLGMLVLTAILLQPPRAPALTAPSTISNDTTWTVADSPVSITNSCTVLSNATLTIEPGVTVKVNGSLSVNGQLQAVGLATNRIIFDELNPGSKWGALNFNIGSGNIAKTNQLLFTTFTNLGSYIYISQQTVIFSNCHVHINGNLWNYGLAAYVNTSVSYLVGTRLLMVSNAFEITSTGDYAANPFRFVIMDGFPSEFRGNTFTFTVTGRYYEVSGFYLYVSNTRDFLGHFVDNVITVNTITNGALLDTYGLRCTSDVDGLVSNNTITVSGPRSVWGIWKYGHLPVVNNTLQVASTVTAGGYGDISGVQFDSTDAGTNDLIVNNRIYVSTAENNRVLYGIQCEDGLTRGNLIVLQNQGTNGSAHGIYQVYYPAYLEGNSISVSATPGVWIRGINLSTHYNTSSVIMVYNNLIVGTNINQASGLYKDASCAASVVNGYNLVYNFQTNFVGLASGPGDLTNNPLLTDTNLHISATSPARDAGTNRPWTFSATDLDGRPRIHNDTVDIGAYEFTTNTISVTMSSSVGDPTRTSSIPVTVLFGEDVSGFTNTDITPGNATLADFSMVGASNYTFNLIPTNQGLVTADIPAGAAQGVVSSNSNAAASQFRRVYDSIGPTGAITAASASPTNAATIIFTIGFNELITGLSSNDLTRLSSGSATSAPPALTGSASNYTVTLNNVAENGWLGIALNSNQCADLAGNSNAALSAVSNLIDTTRPTCTIARTGESPTNAASIGFAITFNENVNGFTASGLTLSATGSATGTLTNFGGSGTNYAVTVAGLAGEGAIGIEVASSNAWDLAGNGNQAGARVDYQIDRLGPLLTISEPSASLTRSGPVEFTVTYQDAATIALAASNISLEATGTATGLAHVSGSGTAARTVTLTSITGDGTLGISLSAATAWDVLGNPALAATSTPCVVDNTAPTATISSTVGTTTALTPIPLTITFSEAVTGFAREDAAAGNATFSSFSAVSASLYSLELIPLSLGSLTVSLPANAAADAAGNGNMATGPWIAVYTLSPPGAVSASDGKYNDRVCVTWSAATGATQYEVWRNQEADSSKASRLGSATGVLFDDLAAEADTIYYYWVKAANTIGASQFGGSDTGWQLPAASSYPGGADFDGDGKADPFKYYLASDEWRILLSADAYALFASSLGGLGGIGYKPAPADFDSDGKADPATYQIATGQWRILQSAESYALFDSLLNGFGSVGYWPAPADFDGDGKADPAIYQIATGQWQILLSAANYELLAASGEDLGGAGYEPAPADFDGDGLADPAVYQVATGQWRILLSTLNYAPFVSAAAESDTNDCHAVPADYDGDAFADPAIYQESTGWWWILLSGDNYTLHVFSPDAL
ncbi:MAG: VCBS repeat-containing protein [Lentisphaerae bacterium]|nr:VCBS repeat-containing protein [Lentisphaerota bacterium]